MGFRHLQEEAAPEKTLRVTLIQPSIPQTLIWDQTKDNDRFQETCTRLSVSEHYRKKLSAMRRRAEDILPEMERTAARADSLERSAIHSWLHELPAEVHLYMMAKTTVDEVRKSISLYITQLQNAHCLINGADLERLGVPKGPLFRELLDMVLIARLDHRVAMSFAVVGSTRTAIGRNVALQLEARGGPPPMPAAVERD